MKRNFFSLPFLLVLAAFALNSCSGPVLTTCTSNCGGGGGGGTGSVVVTVTSTPSQTFFFPFLDWQVLSVDLINSSGDTNLLAGALPPVEFAHLQTDTQFIGINKSFPVGTYTSAKIQLAPASVPSYFFNSSGATLLGCAAGAVCKIPNSVTGFGAATVTVPISFSLAANATTGFSLNFDLSKAVTSTGGMTFDFTQAGAITLATLPRAGQNPAGLDSFQNFTGTVQTVTSTTITISSLSSAPQTFTVSSTAEFDDPFQVCTTANFACLKANQNVSVDAFINSDGTFTAYEVDFLDGTPAPLENEGIIVTPVSGGQFQMVVTNSTSITSGFFQGTLVTVNVNGASTYAVDPKNLGSSVSTTPVGFQSSTDLVVGQSVMLQGGTANFTTTPNTLSGNTRTLLRYSSIGGTVTTPSGTIFTLSGVSPFFTNLSSNSVSVQTFPNTTYDNITGGFTGLTGVTNASVRGLYLNPNSGVTQPLLAAQVRAHL